MDTTGGRELVTKKWVPITVDTRRHSAGYMDASNEVTQWAAEDDPKASPETRGGHSAAERPEIAALISYVAMYLTLAFDASQVMQRASAASHP